jgi:hypothetical protein
MPSEKVICRQVVVFGIPVVFHSSDCRALEDAADAFSGAYRSESMLTLASIYVVIEFHPLNAASGDDKEDVVGSNLRIKRNGMALEADGAAGQGRCVFEVGTPSDVLQDAVTTVVLFLVAHAGRIPLHASAIMLGETAIAFAGRSGSGKSTLALAGSRAGLPVLSDDTIFVQTEPTLRVWSRSEAIHVLEKDAPESNESSWRLRAGRWKKAFAFTCPPARFAERSILCLLDRGQRVSLTPLDPDKAAAEAVADPEPGYEFYGERSLTAARALARGGAWRLALSCDPMEAIDLVRRTFASLEAAQPLAAGR